jgi:Phasin protein
MSDSTTKTTTAKPTSYSKMDATQLFRATAENGSAQVKESFERMSAATAEATAQIKDSYSTALKGAQDYNAKLFEFAQNNSKAAIEFVQKLSGAEIANRFHRIVDRSFTQAVRDTDRADQGTCSAGSEGHARDRRAHQDGCYQGIRPAYLS